MSARAVLAVLSLLLATPAAAATVTIDTSLNPLRPGLENQGWWPPTIGFSNFEESDAYFTGRPVGSQTDTEVRSFFSFFLDPALLAGGTVTSATFVVRRGLTQSDGSQETLGLFDVTSPIGLVAHNVLTNVGVWTDLGTGISYGTAAVGVGGNADDNLFIPLNADALTRIQASIGDYFTLGTAVLSGDGFLFGSTGAVGTQALVLEVSVPAPGAFHLLFPGVIALAAVRVRASRGSRGAREGRPSSLAFSLRRREPPRRYAVRHL